MRLEDVWMIDVFDLVVKKIATKSMFCHFQTNTIGHSSCCLCLAPLKLDGPKTPWWMRSFRGSLSSAVVWWICRASQRNGEGFCLFAVAQVGVTERSVGLVSCFAFFLEIGQKTFKKKNQKDMRIIGLHSTFGIRNSSCFDLFFCGNGFVGDIK